MFFFEVVLDDVGLSRSAPEIGAKVRLHLGRTRGAPPTDRVGLRVLVQELVGVELWTVGREKEHPDPPLFLLAPALHRRRAVHRMTIDDKKHLPSLHVS